MGWSVRQIPGPPGVARGAGDIPKLLSPHCKTTAASGRASFLLWAREVTEAGKTVLRKLSASRAVYPSAILKRPNENFPVKLKPERELEAAVHHSWAERMLNPERGDQSNSIACQWALGRRHR